MHPNLADKCLHHRQQAEQCQDHNSNLQDRYLLFHQPLVLELKLREYNRNQQHICRLVESIQVQDSQNPGVQGQHLVDPSNPVMLLNVPFGHKN